LDSLKNGYTIGSVLFWKPDTNIKKDLIVEEIQLIGGYSLEISESQDYQFILDGYQRLSTLFGCFIDSNSTKLKQNIEERNHRHDRLVFG